MQSIDPALQGSPSRIQRDLRFHPNQPPLRGCPWVIFQDKRIQPEERPAFFPELFPDPYRYGMGFYAASSAKMERFRRAVDGNPARFERVVGAIPPHYQLMGELYKRSRGPSARTGAALVRPQVALDSGGAAHRAGPLQPRPAGGARGGMGARGGALPMAGRGRSPC